MGMPSVRDRTLVHLQHLMTAGALASCARDADPVKHDPPPSTSAVTSASASASVAADPPPTVAPPPPVAPSATITAKPKPTATSTAGYLVVDMLPTPARCLAVAKNATISGRFEPDPGGPKLRFVVTLKTPNVTFASTTPQTISATLLSSSFPNWTTAEIELRPAGAPLAGVQLVLSCGAYGSAILAVHATFAGAPAVGRPVTLTMTDY
jgi:hypothetical protein